MFRLLRTLYVSLWFYYGPFTALGLSFVFGFLLQEDTKIVAKDGSSMGDEYQEWLKRNRRQQVEGSSYQELEIPDLVNLMKNVPLPSLPEGEEWNQPTDY